MLEKITSFLKESKIELKKVIWPTRNETIRYTVVVIVISAALAIFLGILDIMFQYLIHRFVL